MNPNSNVRTFRAADARSALSAVRAALGGEAVILETREVAGGLFGKALIEVTAAGPASSAPETRRAAFESAPAALARGGRRVPVTDLEGEVGALRRLVEEMRHRLPGNRSNGLPGGAHENGRGTANPLDDGATAFTPEEAQAWKHLVRRGMEDFLARGLIEQARRLGMGGAG